MSGSNDSYRGAPEIVAFFFSFFAYIFFIFSILYFTKDRGFVRFLNFSCIFISVFYVIISGNIRSVIINNKQFIVLNINVSKIAFYLNDLFCLVSMGSVISGTIISFVFF